jgi:hydrogenase expression/formation protein HypC
MCLGIPGQIVEITDTAALLAKVEVGGVRREVNIACIVDADHPPAACEGDWALIHVGFAMSRISPQEAARTLAILDELGEMKDEYDAFQASAGGMETKT